MIIFEYGECHGNGVEHDVSVENVEVWAEQNVVDDVALSSKEKSMLCSLD